MLAVLCLLTVPAGMLLCVAADPIVRILLGEKWLPAVALIQILSVFGIVRALHGPTGSVFLALGKPRLVAAAQVIQIGVAITSMVQLIPVLGTSGAAWSILIGACLAAAMNYFLLLRELQMPFGRVARAIWRPLLGGASMGFAGLAMQFNLPKTNVAVQLFSISLAAVAAYLLTIFVSWRLAGRPDGGEQVIAELLNSRWQIYMKRKDSSKLQK
jgi:O-antigen/teichoic acid export membrane protein